MERRKFINLVLAGSASVFVPIDSFSFSGILFDKKVVNPAVTDDINDLLKSGRAEFLNGNFTESIEAYKKALELNPGHIQTYDGIRKPLIATKSEFQYLELIRNGWKSHQSNASFYDRFARALLSIEMGNNKATNAFNIQFNEQSPLKLASDIYLKAIELFPDNKEIQYGINDFVARRKKYSGRKSRRAEFVLSEKNSAELGNALTSFELIKPRKLKDYSVDELYILKNRLTNRLTSDNNSLSKTNRYKRLKQIHSHLLTRHIEGKEFQKASKIGLETLNLFGKDNDSLKLLKRFYSRRKRFDKLVAVYRSHYKPYSFAQKITVSKYIQRGYSQGQFSENRVNKSIEKLNGLFSDELTNTQIFYIEDQLIKSHLALGNKRDAKEILKSRFRQFKDSTQPDHLVSQYALAAGNFFRKVGKKELAIRILEKTIGEYNGTLEEDVSFIEIVVANTAMEESKMRIPIRKKLAKLYFSNGQLAKARQQCEAIEAISPKDVFTRKFKEKL